MFTTVCETVGYGRSEGYVSHLRNRHETGTKPTYNRPKPDHCMQGVLLMCYQ